LRITVANQHFKTTRTHRNRTSHTSQARGKPSPTR
jgi:hypothetical protein